MSAAVMQTPSDTSSDSILVPCEDEVIDLDGSEQQQQQQQDSLSHVFDQDPMFEPLFDISESFPEEANFDAGCLLTNSSPTAQNGLFAFAFDSSAGEIYIPIEFDKPLPSNPLNKVLSRQPSSRPKPLPNILSIDLFRRTINLVLVLLNPNHPPHITLNPHPLPRHDPRHTGTQTPPSQPPHRHPPRLRIHPLRPPNLPPSSPLLHP